MNHFDMIIRNGTIVDGSGEVPYAADLAIKDGLIVNISPAINATASREINAQGKYVTPGFVDVHTHYDGQVSWDNELKPSSHLGVTTVVMGNCGVGFAPCKPQDRQSLIELMEGVEEIPGTALAEGINWEWHSFAQYLDFLERLPRDIDVAALVPHGPLRVYVMGQRALDREAATADDINKMQQLLAQALQAGGVGFSTTRTLLHRSINGEQAPTYKAASQEVKQLGKVLNGDKGHVLQLISDWEDIDEEFDILHKVCANTGVTGTYSLIILNGSHVPGMDMRNQWRELLQHTERAQNQGCNIIGQVTPRPVAIIMGHSTSLSPFRFKPTFKKYADLPLPELVEVLKKPEIKSAILAEHHDKPHIFIELMADKLSAFFVLEEPLEYFPTRANSIAAKAELERREITEWLYDYLLLNEGKNLIYIPASNFAEAKIPDLLSHPHTVMGLGDGGAHVGSICDASTSIYLITRWVKEKSVFDIAQAVRMLTREPAQLYSLLDRGLLKPGMKADCNILDMEKLHLKAPHVVQDLPAGGKRLLQVCEGIDCTIVAGKEIVSCGESTGNLPGKLIRGAQQDPTTTESTL